MRTDKTSVYTRIRNSFGGMESEPMLTPREKSPLPKKKKKKKILRERRTHDAASNRTVSPTHCQRAIPAPAIFLMYFCIQTKGGSIRTHPFSAFIDMSSSHAPPPPFRSLTSTPPLSPPHPLPSLPAPPPLSLQPPPLSPLQLPPLSAPDPPPLSPLHLLPSPPPSSPPPPAIENTWVAWW